MFGLLETHAREKLSITVPPEWKAYKWEAFPDCAREPMLYQELTGGVAPTTTRGKRKGKPNWRKMDKTTKRTVVITVEEHKAWLIEWEKKTGLCSRCEGTGKLLESWSREEGDKYRPCPKCNGTGFGDFKNVRVFSAKRKTEGREKAKE